MTATGPARGARHGAAPPTLLANRRAPHGASRGAPSEAGDAAPPIGLVESGLTVNPPESHGHFGHSSAEWDARDDALREWRCERVARHFAIASRAHEHACALPEGWTERRDELRSLAAWHEARGRTLCEPFRARRDGCGQRRHVMAWCDSCGEVHAIPVGCGLGAWCEVCAHRRTKTVRRRLLPAIASAERRALAKWNRGPRARGTRPSPKLITLTVRDTGDADRDRRTISDAWRRFRAWIQHRQGACPFVLTWEVTDGAHGIPHVHAHVVVIWPWVAVQVAAAEWVRATRGAAAANGFDMKARSTHAAAKYAAKYATKGCDASTVSRETWAAWTRASAGRRSYTTSRGLLLDEPPTVTPCCGSEGRWGAAELRKGPAPERQLVPTGPPVSRETGPGP